MTTTLVESPSIAMIKLASASIERRLKSCGRQGLIIDTKYKIRAAFAGTLFLFAFELPFSWSPHEIYPALTLPAFPFDKKAVVKREADITVHFADGHSAPLSFDEIIPSAPQSGGIVAFNFGNDRVAHDPDAVAWLQQRVANLFPGRRPTSLEIVWQQTTYSRNPPRHETLKVTHLDLT
jgi:hypothetical protein